MALTSTSNCTQWYSAWSGNFYTTATLPNNWTLSQAATLHCTKWDDIYTGTLDVSTGLGTQNVNIVSSTTLPTTLQGTANNINLNTINSGLYPLPVKFNQAQPILISSGANTVQLDASLYPIPVIDQGTAPTEIYLSSGSVLSTTSDLSTQAQQFYLTTIAQIFGVAITVALLILFITKLLIPITREFIKKLW
jgi:hypothetical protein